MLKKYCKFFGLCALAIMPLCAELSDYEKSLVRTIPAYARLAEDEIASFESLDAHDYLEQVVCEETIPNALFQHHPALRGKLSYISLGDLPTEVHHCSSINLQFPDVDVYIKHDGTTGRLDNQGNRTFGGNKLRKLQYLLADAIAHGHDTVLTFGCVGSNHALQTAVCARNLNLHCICMLTPQPNAYVVQRNLLLQQVYGAQLIFAENSLLRAQATIDLCTSCKSENKILPYIIYTGGSVPRGAIGYVEAAFELKEQILAGLLPEPDHIYVTCGSCGTAAGLLLGCKAAGISTKFHLVLEEPADVDTVHTRLGTLIRDTNDLICSYDSTFPQCTIDENDYELLAEYGGEGYGEFTVAGVEAIRAMSHLENIRLDGVYSGKCGSALFADLNSGKLQNTTVLFWNTFCGADMHTITDQVDYRNLPQALHRWFEEPVQLLDTDPL